MGRKRKSIEEIKELDSKMKVKHQLDDIVKEEPKPNEQTTTTIETVELSKIKWNEINIKELNSLYIRDIRVIAESIGISSTSYKKQELISKIKFIINMNNDAISNKLKKDNCNPFNKSTFNQLVITPDKQGQDELLFWKIFKSKPIFKHIMSFIGGTPNPLRYDYIISIRDMLVDNQIGILMDKVKRNQYISFKDTNTGTLSLTLYSKMFSKIQDDQLFYQSLFTNYKEQFTTIDFNEEISNILIGSNCLIGFKVFIQVFNYIPTSNNLKVAIGNHKLEFIKLIKRILKLDTITLINQYDYYPKFNNSLKVKKNYEIVKEFEKNFNLVKYKITSSWLDQINPLSIRLKDLIKVLELIELIDPEWELYQASDLVNKNLHNLDLKTLKVDAVRNTIKSYQFTDQQLKSNVNDPIKYSSTERDTIRMLLHVFYTVKFSGKLNWYLGEYFFCYHVKGNKFPFIDNHGPIRVSLEYGNIQPFPKSHFNRHQEKLFEICSISSVIDPFNILFKNCSNKESQHKFINSYIQNQCSNNNILLLL